MASIGDPTQVAANALKDTLRELDSERERILKALKYLEPDFEVAEHVVTVQPKTATVRPAKKSSGPKKGSKYVRGRTDLLQSYLFDHNIDRFTRPEIQRDLHWPDTSLNQALKQLIEVRHVVRNTHEVKVNSHNKTSSKVYQVVREAGV